MGCRVQGKKEKKKVMQARGLLRQVHGLEIAFDYSDGSLPCCAQTAEQSLPGDLVLAPRRMCHHLLLVRRSVGGLEMPEKECGRPGACTPECEIPGACTPECEIPGDRRLHVQVSSHLTCPSASKAFSLNSWIRRPVWHDGSGESQGPRQLTWQD